MRSFLLLSILITATWGAARSQAEAPAATPATGEELAVYDPDPNHLWNRLFAAFYRQHLEITVSNPNSPAFAANPPPKELWMGPDVLDPPFGTSPPFLDREQFERCDALLDEFLQRGGEQMIRDPLKRVVLQRDLWAVFDAVQGGESFWSSGQKHRLTLARKVAQVMRALSLSPEEIEKLPNTFRDAIASGAFSSEPKRGQYDFLDTDFFDPQSGWIETSTTGPLIHTSMVNERSVFRVFIKPAKGSPGAQAASEWRRRVDETLALRQNNPGRTIDDPPTPALELSHLGPGTRLVLLREMLCLDTEGQPRPTHIVESVQMRGSVDWETNAPVYLREVELNRKLLFQRSQGGLKPIVRGELRVDAYYGLGLLRVQKRVPMSPFSQNCLGCHGGDRPLTLFSSLAGLNIAREPHDASIRVIATKVGSTNFIQLRQWMLKPAEPKKSL